jgi:entry exclusion lipoprotein TrbK
MNVRIVRGAVLAFVVGTTAACAKKDEPPLEANNENCAKVSTMPPGPARDDLAGRCIRRVSPPASSPQIPFQVK